MIIPQGFIAASYELRLAGFNRSAYITMGHINTPGYTDAVEAAEDLHSFFGVASGPTTRIDNNVTVATVTARVGTASGEPLIGVSDNAVACTRSMESPPPNVAVLVHKRTPQGGRRNRGRFFLPWAISEAEVGEDGTLTALGISGLSTALGVWMTTLTSNSVIPYLLHSLGQSAAPAPTPITSLTVDPVISTQRRRLGRR